MKRKLDLHIHSAYSLDGRMSLAEIIRQAKAAGLDGCAVCDHDHILPPEALREAAEAFPDFLLIPGTEVSTHWGHLLGWFVTEPVRAKDFPEAVREIHDQGGIAVLAHPFEHLHHTDHAASAAALADGVEVWNSRAERKNPRANTMAEDLAASFHLRRFAGSDAHVAREIGNGVTMIDVPALTLASVRNALLSGDTETAGRRSRAMDTARSQFTLRRKRGDGLFSYCKWALFAVKCAGEDWVRF